MNENNSPSDESNQEPISELDSELENEELDEAMREKDSLRSDTEPPPAYAAYVGGRTETVVPPPSEHGWLEQFPAFSGRAFDELEAVAKQGLTEAELSKLLGLAERLVRLAYNQNPESLKDYYSRLA
jgi:hypothetical protein